MAPSARWPRISVTSNQSSPRTVVDARATAEVMASSIEVVDVPTTSLMPYVCAMALTLRPAAPRWHPRRR